MFSTFKNKFFSVQDGISTGLRGLSNGIPVKDSWVNTGGNSLLRHQAFWKNIHELSENNAQIVKAIDSEIDALHLRVINESSFIEEFTCHLVSLRPLSMLIESVVIDIGKIRELLNEVEKDLIDLQDSIETSIFDERVCNSLFQYTLYKERKLAEIESKKDTMGRIHNEKVKFKEHDRMKEMREKESVFGEIFQNELEAYKKTGQLPEKRTDMRGPSPNLEDITLELDNSELEKYLED